MLKNENYQQGYFIILVADTFCSLRIQQKKLLTTWIHSMLGLAYHGKLSCPKQIEKSRLTSPSLNGQRSVCIEATKWIMARDSSLNWCDFADILLPTFRRVDCFRKCLHDFSRFRNLSLPTSDEYVGEFSCQ